MLAQRFGEALKAILVVELHAPRVGGNAQEIGDEEKQRLRVGRTEIAVERGELFFLCAARVKLAHIANEDHLERSHQRGRLRAVEHFEDGGGGEVEIGEAEIAQIGRHKGFEHGGAAAVEKKDLVAGEHIAGAQLAVARRGSFDLRDKAADGGKACAPARGGQTRAPPSGSDARGCDALARISHASPEYRPPEQVTSLEKRAGIKK